MSWITHGDTRGGRKNPHRRAPEYRAWQAMRSRCFCETDRLYPKYGGRGITVCEQWKHSYAAFLADMGRKPSAAHSVDRINGKGNYEPSNCRWATPREQSRNISTNRRLTVGDRTKLLCEWAEECGVPSTTILTRMKRGWTPERAILTPIDVKKRNHRYRVAA